MSKFAGPPPRLCDAVRCGTCAMRCGAHESSKYTGTTYARRVVYPPDGGCCGLPAACTAQRPRNSSPADRTQQATQNAFYRLAQPIALSSDCHTAEYRRIAVAEPGNMFNPTPYCADESFGPSKSSGSGFLPRSFRPTGCTLRAEPPHSRDFPREPEMRGSGLLPSRCHAQAAALSSTNSVPCPKLSCTRPPMAFMQLLCGTRSTCFSGGKSWRPAPLHLAY